MPLRLHAVAQPVSGGEPPDRSVPPTGTADGAGRNDLPDGSAADNGAQASGTTQPSRLGQPIPRLPHERDASSDSQTQPPHTGQSLQAVVDASEGKVDMPRGPSTQLDYSALTAASAADAQAKGTEAVPDPAHASDATTAGDERDTRAPTRP